MLTVHNKTLKPLRVPLPHGKSLHLQPNGYAAINDHAADFPALVALATAGSIEIHDGEVSHPDGPHAVGHASPSAKVHAKRTQRGGDR